VAAAFHARAAGEALGKRAKKAQQARQLRTSRALQQSVKATPASGFCF